MGAESSVLKGCVLDKPLDVSLASGWSLQPAKQRDGPSVSVFVNTTTEQVDRAPLRNAAKCLKTLRHPSIVKFLDWCENREGIYLITERVRPLSLVCGSLSAAEICAGLHNILEALCFLNEKCGMTHNNVCVSSVFVSPDGSWKLGGMECVARFADCTPDYLRKIKPLRDEKSVPPQDKDVISQQTEGHETDAYAFGILAEQFLEVLSDLGDMTKTFELRIQDDLLNPDPGKRPRLSTLLEDRLFKNDFIEILKFLQSFIVKKDEEKKEFFKSLVPKLLDIPAELAGSRLVRPLLSRFVLLDATAAERLVPHLLTPASGKDRHYAENGLNPVFPVEVFRKHVIPEVYKIFHVRDAHIRLVLLSCFENYVEMFDKETLKQFILPQLLLGLRDTNDDLVSASLRALAHLVPILGAEVVIGGQRGKLFAEGKPKFHTRSQLDRTDKVSSEKQNSAANGIRPSPVKKTLQEIAKEADREKRREEAKRRNEERRRKREERKNNPVKAVLVDDFVTNQQEDNNTVSAEEETAKDEEDWSDWSDSNKTDDIYIEDQVNNERNIESEMNSINQEIPDVPKMNWNETSPSRQTSGSEQKSKSKPGKGALRLGKDKDKKKNDDLDKDWKNDKKWTNLEDTNLGLKGSAFTDWQTDWNDALPVDTGANKLSDKSKISKKVKAPLGSEFDFEIKAKPEFSEPDFFADMVPEVKTEDSVLNSVLKAFQEEKPSSKLAFAPIDSEQDVGDAWGEDIAWEEPETTST